METDRRPKPWNLPGLLRLRRQIGGFDMVYDLQTSQRSSRYFRLAGSPPWSGIAPGCSLPHANPARNFMHSLERQREQLQMAGISDFPPVDLGWLVEPPFAGLPERAALLVRAPRRTVPPSDGPAAAYAELAARLAARGLAPVVIGTSAEAPLARAIPSALDLTGRTTIAQVAAIAARAEVAIGNDTGRCTLPPRSVARRWCCSPPTATPPSRPPACRTGPGRPCCACPIWRTCRWKGLPPPSRDAIERAPLS